MKTSPRQMVTMIAAAALTASPTLSVMSADASVTGSADGPRFAPRSQAVTRLITKDLVEVAGDSGGGHESAVSANCHAVTFDTHTPFVPKASTTLSGNHVYLRLRGSHQVRLVDRGIDKSPANGVSMAGSISKTGRYVAYASRGSNLVRNDHNDATDIFVRDFGSRRWRAQLVSVATDGGPANSGSDNPTMSASGRYVAFESAASNLVPNDTNARLDVFVRDRAEGTTERVSVGPGGAQAEVGSSTDAVISGNGRYVAYQSDARYLVPDIIIPTVNVFRYDRVTGTTALVSFTLADYSTSEAAWGPSISKTGRYIAFTSSSPELVFPDTNNEPDVFIRDMDTGTTKRVSVTSGGAQASGSNPSLSGDGQTVAFESTATNLARHDTNGFADVFLHRADTGVTRQVSVSSTGEQGDRISRNPSINRSGRCITFASEATNLVNRDTNQFTAIFLRRLAY